MGYPGQVKAQVYRQPWSGMVSILLRQVACDGKVSIATNIVFSPAPDNNAAIEPTFHMQPDEAQILMDELWQCGFRPTEGTGSAGALKATENHLSDMRKLVFALLEAAKK